MSAYMVDRNHIRYLVEAARCRRLNGDGTLYWFHCGVAYLLDSNKGTDCVNRPPAAVGQMLWDENRTSIEARYPDTREDFSNATGPCDESFVYDRHELLSREPFDPVQVLKSCACYEYQACEHDGWKDSEAHAFIEALRDHAIAALPGYDNAIWGAPKPRF